MVYPTFIPDFSVFPQVSCGMRTPWWSTWRTPRSTFLEPKWSLLESKRRESAKTSLHTLNQQLHEPRIKIWIFNVIILFIFQLAHAKYIGFMFCHLYSVPSTLIVRMAKHNLCDEDKTNMRQHPCYIPPAVPSTSFLKLYLKYSLI